MCYTLGHKVGTKDQRAKRSSCSTSWSSVYQVRHYLMCNYYTFKTTKWLVSIMFTSDGHRRSRGSWPGHGFAGQRLPNLEPMPITEGAPTMLVIGHCSSRSFSALISKRRCGKDFWAHQLSAPPVCSKILAESAFENESRKWPRWAMTDDQHCGSTFTARPFGPRFCVFRSNMTFRSRCFQQNQAF